MSRPLALQRVSIEVSQRCSKGCWFCYSASQPGGGERWTAAELIAFGRDLAESGVEALSFGGGEPLEFAGIFEVLAGLRGRCFRSLTSNGLPLRDPAVMAALVEAAPEKVHISIHEPGSAPELERVIAQVHELAERGLRSGVNLLVARSQLAAAAAAGERLRAAGISNARIVYLPMRGQDSPEPAELAAVAGAPELRFQSMTCLARCAPSPRFASVSWDKGAAWCSYTSSRRPLPSLDFAGLAAALEGLGLEFCGGAPSRDERPALAV